MPKIVIDGKTVEAQDGLTVFKAAAAAGVDIPHFCYHPAFVPEGSCRLCLVEIAGSAKLELSCSTVVREGMTVSTQSPRVQEARKSVLEFLLAEHPLDCPICDKAGECKLQDYYRDHGLTESAFSEFKERREKKVRIGEKLLLDRERCILCTRCVRFLTEITRTQELGVFERGVHAEISTYEGELVASSYSGNLVDLCPVGAITDTEFRFKTRPWFLTRGESICPLCSRGCNIFVDYQRGMARVPKSAKVLRIRPRVNPDVNGHWLCDYGRYGYMTMQRDNRSENVTRKSGLRPLPEWDDVAAFLGGELRRMKTEAGSKNLAVVVTPWLTNEELFLVKKIFIENLGAGRVYFAGPAAAEGDGLLLTSERAPNSRGALEIGLDTRPFALEALAETTGMLWIFGSDVGEPFSTEAFRAAAIPLKIVVSSRLGALTELADIVLPSATAAEKSGSFTNIDGRIQKFAAVARSCGATRPASDILLNIARAAHLNDPYYDRLADVSAIFEALAGEIPFFGKRS
jgi:NADH-quinone oxidoreductase subunit G